MLQVDDWTQSSASLRRKVSPKHGAARKSSYSPLTPGQDVSETAMEVSLSHSSSLPKAESPPTPTSRHLLGPRQRTHSAPVQHPSSLSRLLAQGTPPIEEVKERTSPSPPALPSRTQSPLHARASSSLVSPPHSHPSSPLASPALATPASPLAGSANSRPSSPLVGPSYVRRSPPIANSSYGRPVSPLAGPAHPRPSSPLIATLSGPSPSHASPNSTTSPLHTGSRRSSSSSRPSRSSIFSVGRHPFTLSTGPAKASATTALSDPKGHGGVSPPGGRPVSNHSREELVAWANVTPSPERSPGEGVSNDVLARRRTTSGSVHGRERSSPLSSSTKASRPQSTSGGPLANLASSLGVSFGKKKTGVVRQSTGDGSTATARGASDILKRFDDVLPQERFGR